MVPVGLELGIASTSSLARSRRCQPSTRRTSLFRIAWPLAWIACNVTSSPCGARPSNGGSSSYRLRCEIDHLPGFIEGDLNAPKHLAGIVHDFYFNPKYEEFQPRTMWSLSNAFTSAFKNLIPSRSSRRQRNSARFLRRRFRQLCKERLGRQVRPGPTRGLSPC